MVKQTDSILRIRKKQSLAFFDAVLVGCLVVMAVIFAGVAAYTGLRGDDYGVLQGYSGGGLVYAVERAFDTTRQLLQAGGGYAVSYFVNSIVLSGIVEGKISLTAFMVGGSILLLSAISLLVCVAGYSAKVFSGKEEIAVALFFVASSWYLLLDSQKWREINTWVTGYNGYAFPMILALVAGGMMCQNSSARGIRIVVAAVLAFFASGGSLQITGVYCYFLLIVLFVKLFQKRTKPADWIVFGSAFLGALLNLVAPGNYVRRLNIDSTGFHPGIALPFIIRHTNDTIISIIKTPFGIPILLGILVLGTENSGRFKQKTAHLILLILACVEAPYISTAPVCLGYGGSYFPNRCQWVTTLTADISLMCITYVLGILVGRMLVQSKQKTISKVISSGIVLLAIFGIITFSGRSALYSTAMHLADGTVAGYAQTVSELETLFVNSEGKSVIVTQSLEQIDEVYPLIIREDPQSTDNQLLVNYYHLKSLVYNPEM